MKIFSSLSPSAPQIQTSTNSDRIFYLDFLRILACLGVIFIHTHGLEWSTTDVRTIDWKIIHAYKILPSWANVLFVMISGALHLSKEKITTKDIAKKIGRIILVYLFWNFAYAFFAPPLLHTYFHWQLIFVVICKYHYHLWFLLMLIGLYLAIPVLKAVVSNKDSLKAFLILSIVFSFFIPTFYSVYVALPDFVPFTWAKTFITLSKNVIDTVDFHLTLGCTCYFVLGYVLYKYDVPKKYRIVFYILAILSYAFRLSTSLIKSHNLGTHSSYNSSLNIFIEATAIFLFAKYFVSKCKNEKFILMLKKIASLTFGIYLIHDMVLIYLSHFGINPIKGSPLITIPLNVLMVFAISALAIFLIKKIPFLKRFC